MVHWGSLAGWCAAFCLVGCAASPTLPEFDARLNALLPTSAVLLGEQHDAPEHQRIHRDLIAALAQRGLLADVAIEMAEQGHSTASLDRHAREDQVRSALQWRESEWAWAHYGPAVMTAVRAGVAVYGANLPRADMRTAMSDTRLDLLLDAPALAEQQQSVRTGHCDLLPVGQIIPMTRIQIARDVAMARTLQANLRPGKTAVLLAGSAHVNRRLGVPLHLGHGVQATTVLLWAQTGRVDSEPRTDFEQVWQTTPLAEKDYCALFKAQTQPMPLRP